MPKTARITRKLSHIARDGSARMVDVGGKLVTQRTARAEAVVRLGASLVEALRKGGLRKGNPVESARIAGIMAAKRTAELIPLCHSIPLDVVEVHVTFGKAALRIESTVRAHHVTGVEMEALTAAAVAALTIYDMCKAADKGIVIEQVRLLEKTGGKSGAWRRTEPGSP
jgi:cyclic pyranopterin phosphate synthase